MFLNLWTFRHVKKGHSPPIISIEGVQVPKSNEIGMKMKTEDSPNAKLMNALIYVVSSHEFNRVCNCFTTKKIWYILEVTQKGTNQVKEFKINLLEHQ